MNFGNLSATVLFLFSLVANSATFGPGQSLPSGVRSAPSSGGGGSGITSLGGQTDSSQSFATATSGSDFAISSSGGTHTFALPDAGASARGLVTTGTQTIAGAKTFSSAITGSLTGNASTSSALASNPADCGSNTFATAIAANGDLTCGSVGNAATTATSANTASAIVARDGSGNFTAGTITATLSGNASTATALASNPSDCSAGQYATAIAANGNLTCATPSVTYAEVDDGNSSTADTIDWSAGNAHKSTLTGNVTYTFTAPSAAGTPLVLRVLTGAGSFTATWPATVKWSGGTAPTITTTASRMDLISFYFDGTNYYGTFNQNYTP